MDYRNVIRFKDQLEWKPLKGLYVKNNADWSPAKTAWVKIDGTWRQIYPTPRAQVSLNPQTLNFPVTYITMTTGNKRVYINNTGNEVLTINSIDVNPSTEFDMIVDTSSWGGSSVQVNPGAQCFIDISLKGKTLGASSASLTLNTTIGALGASSSVITVTTEVVPLFASLSVSAGTPINFQYEQYVRKVIGYSSSFFGLLRTKPIYSTPAPLPSASVTVKNSGNTGLQIKSVTVDSDLYDISTWKAAIAANGTQTITFTLNQTKAEQRLAAGQALDDPEIRIASVADNGQAIADLVIPTTLKLVPHGTAYFDESRSITSWTVPEGIDNDIILNIKANPGGTGGNDSQAGGAGGEGGNYNVNLSLPAGSTLTTFFGTKGSDGASGSPIAGGAGGVNAAFPEFNGGAGGSCGAAGWSGSGGGGAAATVVKVKNSSGTTIGTIVAGGGLGGGGGGNHSRGLGSGWNPIVPNTGPTTGGVGQNKGGGDGGGAGGGGGGLPGGYGGTVNPGDNGGNPGYTGKNGHQQVSSIVTQVRYSGWHNSSFASVTIEW